VARAVKRNPRRTKLVEKGAIPRSPATNCYAARREELFNGQPAFAIINKFLDFVSGLREVQKVCDGIVRRDRKH
jgi:hypothetical protein